MSALKDTFQILQNFLLSVDGGGPSPYFKTCQMYRRQGDEEANEAAFTRPAVFIEFESVEWDTRLKGVQEGRATIALHYEFENLNTEDLTFLDIMAEVQIALQGLEETELNPFLRISTQQDLDRTNRIAWIERYTTLIRDDSANYDAKKTVKAPPTPIIVTLDLVDK